MAKNPLNVSDDDLEDLEYTGPANDVAEPEPEQKEEEESPFEEEEQDIEEESEEDLEEEYQEEETDEDENPEDEEEEENSSPEEAEDTDAGQDEEESEEEPQKAKTSAESDMDYATEGKRIFQPFKANGKEIKVDNADDAISLMQMGANYGLKMAALKPNLRLLKTLEKHDLLDEQKINYLIDLSKKRPEAIRKAVKDADIDPFDIEPDTDTEYVPNTYTVSDSEMALNEVLDALEASPSGQEVLDIVGNKWDAKSMQSLTRNPPDILKLRDQVEAGVFARVVAKVDQEKMMGRLTGLSDLEAYTKVGELMVANGEFDDVIKNPVKGKKKPARKARNTARKKAAGTVKSTPKKSTKQDFNPLAVSDEEFEKLVDSQFY